MKYRIILKLSYYDYKYLDLLVRNLFNVLNKFFTQKDCVIKQFNFPVKSNVITVLRSPHVAKKSREQFKKNIYSIGLSIESTDVSIFNFLYYFLLKVTPFLNCTYNLKVSTKCLYEKKINK